MGSITFIDRACLATVLAAACIGPARADGNRAEELRLQAQQKARAEAAQRQAAEHRAQAAKNETDVQRRLLGKVAEGRTDAEVNVLWDQRNADARAQAAAVQAAMPGMVARAQAPQQRLNDPKARADADAGARLVGARSMQDLTNLSDDDLKKLQADLEKKRGRN